MDKTTLLLAGGVFAAVFAGAMVLFPAGGKPAAKPAEAAAPPLTPKQQAEVNELMAPDREGISDAEKWRLRERRDLIKTYSIATIDAADNDYPENKKQLITVVVTPPAGFLRLDVQQGSKMACIARWVDGRPVHETYTFSDTNITTPGVTPLIGWMRSGCAFAIANHGETVTPRRVVQDLLERLPKDAAYDEKRQSIGGYLKDTRYFDDFFYRSTLPFN